MSALNRLVSAMRSVMPIAEFYRSLGDVMREDPRRREEFGHLEEIIDQQPILRRNAARAGMILGAYWAIRLIARAGLRPSEPVESLWEWRERLGA